MKLVGLMLVRNSDWVLGLSLRAALMWCDAVVVLMHRCTDQTRCCIDALADEVEDPRRVWLMEDDRKSWEEMRLRQELLKVARCLKATHIALIDDDEVLTGNLLPDIRNIVQETPPQTVLMLPWLQLAARPDGIDQVMTSGMWSRQNASIGFLDDPAYYWAAQDGYDHHHRHPMGLPFRPWAPLPDRSAGLMHLQFASRRRLLAKQFLYLLTEQKRWPGRKCLAQLNAEYAPTVWEAAAAQLLPYSESWWAPYRHLMAYLHVDAEPWQEKECKRLLAENPGLAVGLEDFGLMKEWGL